jgi:hypothetical protein
MARTIYDPYVAGCSIRVLRVSNNLHLYTLGCEIAPRSMTANSIPFRTDPQFARAPSKFAEMTGNADWQNWLGARKMGWSYRDR